MWGVAYCWPYCALAARSKDDSGDGDDCGWDFIEDLIPKWIPEAVITRMPVTDKLDFTYAIEHEGRLLICFRGTDGSFKEPGWQSDFSPQIESKKFYELGGHVDFIEAGELAAKYFYTLVEKYRDKTVLIGHSRGGPRCMAAGRWYYKNMGILPERIFPFCSPPIFNHKAASEYDACGLGAVTIRPVMYNDPIDLLGLPVLKHVGTELKLPRGLYSAIVKRGIIGRLFYGHAYSSVFAALIKYCKKTGLKKETKWLNDTKWVAKI